METYFKTFPQLSEFFKQSGQNALKFNYVREPYFGRVRFFNKPKNGMEASHKKCRYELPAAVNQLFYYEVRVMPYENAY
jgi:DNA polymerase I-like protein with 3'-5' exonuclease and polymerase domains